jgi:ArsR family transcriptional regulator, arsenate/arsenite/antimonite-responsive transcriptional repressor
MIDEELIQSFKALADRSRLRIVGLLAGGHWMAVEDLAAALALTPGTVVHHLNRLRAAGLVESRPRPPYVEYSLRIGRLAEIGGRLDRIEREVRAAGDEATAADMPAWAEAKERRVLQAFFEGGRLLSIPAQHNKRLVVLRYLAETVFEAGQSYPEKDVNMRLALRHPDVASLRRYLVDEGFMSRASGVYLLRPTEDWPPLN